MTAGALALYQDGTGESYDLADSSHYIAKRNGATVSVKLNAAIEVKVDRTNRRFNVTVTVTNTDTVPTPDAVNEFIVIPINPNVFD